MSDKQRRRRRVKQELIEKNVPTAGYFQLLPILSITLAMLLIYGIASLF